MKLDVKFDCIVEGGALDVYFCKARYYKARVDHGYKKDDCYDGFCPGFTSVKEIEETYNAYDKASNRLWAICEACNLDYHAVMTTARYFDCYGMATGWQKCLTEEQEYHLYECLTAKSPEDLTGIYNNEYYEAALRRLHW